MKPSKPPMSRTAMAARLRLVRDAYANKKSFQAGDIVVLNPVFLPPNYTDQAMEKGIFMPLIVLEVATDHTEADKDMNPTEVFGGQYFRSADIRQDDTVVFAWCPSWMYVLADTKMVTDEPVGTSH